MMFYEVEVVSDGIAIVLPIVSLLAERDMFDFRNI